jgi:hypothetical protein
MSAFHWTVAVVVQHGVGLATDSSTYARFRRLALLTSVAVMATRMFLEQMQE